MITRFDTIHERDRQQDGQTPHDGIDSVYASQAASLWCVFVSTAAPSIDLDAACGVVIQSPCIVLSTVPFICH